ncbi:MAG: hypothetical protein RL038_1189 [Actinomycetota bacterium]|jgi:Zn-dependent protease
MKTTKPAFKVFGVPVFLPPSAGFGVLLVSFFALPSAAAAIGAEQYSVVAVTLALAHGVALYLVILLHEIGHVVAAKKYGYPVVNVVLHIIGGHTAFRNRFKRARHQFFVAVLGPIFTLIPGIFAFLILLMSPPAAIESIATWTLWAAVIGGVLNLLPGLPLDGGSALSAVVWWRTKNRDRGQLAAAYGGLVIAALWVFFPYLAGGILGFSPDTFDIFLAWFIGTWLAFQAWSQIQLIKRGTISEGAVATSTENWELKVRRAVALPTTAVCSEIPLALQAKSAGAAVVVKDGEIFGLVIEEAWRGLDSEVLATTPILQVTRRVFPHDYISKEISLSDYKLQSVGQFQSAQIVLDEAGKIYGVAVPEDQDIK